MKEKWATRRSDKPDEGKDGTDDAEDVSLHVGIVPELDLEALDEDKAGDKLQKDKREPHDDDWDQVIDGRSAWRANVPGHVPPGIVERHVGRKIADDDHDKGQHQDKSEAVERKPGTPHEPGIDPFSRREEATEEDLACIADHVSQKEHEKIDDEDHADCYVDSLDKKHSVYTSI